MEQRHCLECDAVCAAEAKFCINCGATMTAGAPTSEQSLSMNKELNAPTVQALAHPATPVQPQSMAPIAYQPQPIQQQPYQQQPYQQQPYQQQPYQQQPYQQAPIQTVNVVMNNTAPTMMLVQQKSVALSLLLTFFFGPLGMFYSTVSGAVIMLLVSIVLAVFTLGLSVFITWPICMIWGAVAANTYNTTIVTRM